MKETIKKEASDTTLVTSFLALPDRGRALPAGGVPAGILGREGVLLLRDSLQNNKHQWASISYCQ